MAAEDRKPSRAQIQNIQERIRRTEGSAAPAAPPNYIANARIEQKSPGPTYKIANIDLAQLQEAGIPTPNGGRTRVLDEYRLIKHAVLRIAAGGSLEEHLNVVMVTSAQPGEGKTFTALSLAMSVVADEGVQVLLVDLDVVKNECCRRLGIRSEPGLVDLLADSNLRLAQALVATDVPRLAVLPAGSNHPLAHELIASPKMYDLVHQLSSMYRHGLVIFDLPPVLASADASVFAENVGQTIVVVEANRTGRASIEQTISLLSGCKRISLILNKASASELIDQYGSYYGEPSYTHAKPVAAQATRRGLAAWLRSQLLRSNKARSSH
jgi:receptor protein-tyrosine kinase